MRIRKIAKRTLAVGLSLVTLLGCLAGIPLTNTEEVYAADLENSKVVELSFEGNANDSSENGINGTISNAGSFVEGMKGQALNLGGNTYVDLGTSAALQPENLTVSMWVKANGTLSGEHILTWFKPNGNYQGKGWYLSCLDDSTPLKLSVGESTGQPYEIYISGKRSEFFPANEWVHIVVTYDSATKKAAMYRNGVAQELLYINTESVLTNDSTSNKYIGFNSPKYNGGFANVAIDEFVIYNAVASGQEAVDLYTSYGAEFDTASVVDADLAALSFSVNELKHDITLPTEGASGSTISWKSSDASVISETGKVTRPSIDDGDKTVTLTAIVTYGETSKTKEFVFTVKADNDFDTLEDFLLSDVVITDAYEVNAFELEIKYLKSFDADKLLRGFRDIAGVDGKGATVYGGWENSAIKGHTMGHYLTAMAQAYATTKDEEILEKLNYIITSLAECQNESGYLAAIPESHYDKIEAGNTTGTWVPWYTMHKILAGLIDVYQQTGNKEALTVATKLGDWVYSRTSKWTDAVQNKVLAVEYGGMNDCLYELYKITGDDKHAKAAHSFDEMYLFEQLYKGNDILDGRHANTTIPKIIGALNRYIALGESEEYYLQVAENFFSIVTEHHTYITGGNSEWEHFGKADILDGERTECNCETCNSYNMLKLARELYKITGDSKYADYYENTFINAILSSQNPETGMTTYFQPMASGYFKVYSSEFNHFWCCTGSGMESFTKLNDSIYFKGNNSVYVIQYVDSELTYTEGNLKLIQDSSIPESDVTKFTIETIDGKTSDTTLYIRVPDWCAGNTTVKVNGDKVDAKVVSGCLLLDGTWNNGDVIEVTLPMEVVAYSLPDNDDVIAFKYGPIVLSASFGQEDMKTTITGVNVTVPTKNVTINSSFSLTEDTLEDWVKNLKDNVIKADDKLEFTLKGTDCELVFTPHYKQYTDRYGIYFNVVSKATVGSEEYQQQVLAQKEADRLANVTIDSVPVSNDQYELQHNLKTQASTTGQFKGLMYRDATAGGFFSYEMKVDDSVKNYLQVKYYSGDAGRTFKIYVNDTVLADVTLKNENPDNFYDVRYELPAELIEGKETVIIKFETKGSSFAGGIFDRLYIVKDYSTNAGLSGVVVDEHEYTDIQDEMTVYAKEESENVKIKFNILDSYGLVYVNGVLINDAAEWDVALTGETTEIEVVVKAEDHETEKTYKISIVKDSDKANVSASLSTNPNGVNPLVIVLVIVVVIAAAVAIVIVLKKKGIILSQVTNEENAREEEISDNIIEEIVETVESEKTE